MLRFTHKAYSFKPAKPNRFVYEIGMWLNRFYALPGKRHLIKGLDVAGVSRVRQWDSDPSVRLIFVANHSTHSDPEILVESLRRCGVWGCLMAAHDVFARSRIQSWVMQRVGAFSINRENVDRQSINEATRIIKDKRYSLSLFPEGNIAFTNERVRPFLDGASLMAIKAQRLMGDDTKVMVVPVSIRLTHMEDVREKLREQWLKLHDEVAQKGFQVEVDPDLPFHQKIEKLGYAILCLGLKNRGYEFPVSLEMWMTDPDSVMQEMIENLLSELEKEMELAPKGNHEARIRTIRSQLARMRLDEFCDEQVIERWDDQSILILRVQSYTASYLRDCPSIDRCSETLEKLREDSSDTLIRPISHRHVHVHFGEPISVKGKRVSLLTKELESAVNTGLSNYKSPHVGAEMFGA